MGKVVALSLIHPQLSCIVAGYWYLHPIWNSMEWYQGWTEGMATLNKSLLRELL